MNARRVVAKVYQWVFRSAALGEVRARQVAMGPRRTNALGQAKLSLEIARRVAEPVEALPSGSAPAVILGLCRDAVHWALVAGAAEEAPANASLSTLWASYVPERFPSATRDPAALDVLRSVLVEAPKEIPLETSAEDAALARRFAEALVKDLEAPRREIDRLLGQRWSRVAVAGVVAVALALGIRSWSLGPNLAEGKPFRTSSSWSGCNGDPMCSGILFHTNDEANPWAELDLGAPKKFHRIEVTNRDDCCAERAVPLIVETSTDGSHWAEVGRRDKEFSTWTLTFPAQKARYIKFRVPRTTVLHLKQVAVR